MDSFERYKLAIETNRRKAKNGKDNQAKSNNSHVLMDKTEAQQMIQNRHPLTHNLKTTMIPLSQVGSSLLKIKKSTSATMRPNKNILIDNLSDMVKLTPKFFTKLEPKYNNRFSSFTEEVKAPVLDNVAYTRALTAPIEIINWFKNNKFDYALQAKRHELPSNIDERKVLVSEHESKGKHPNDIVKQITHGVYVRPQLKTKLPNPSHTIVQAKRVGKFMYGATVANIHSKNIEKILLMATDTRFVLEKGALLVLKNESSCTKTFNNEELRVYLRWHVYRD